jgi:hypothetical protein
MVVEWPETALSKEVLYELRVAFGFGEVATTIIS